jgi:hypothetical protein
LTTGISRSRRLLGNLGVGEVVGFELENVQAVIGVRRLLDYLGVRRAGLEIGLVSPLFFECMDSAAGRLRVR